MALDTYKALKLEIAGHLDRDDLDDEIDTFIDLAESRHRREVRVRKMLRREPINVGQRHVTLPSKLLQVKLLRLLTDPVTVLEELSPTELSRVRIDSVTGKPSSFTIHETIEFDREPDQNYKGEILYFREVEPLSTRNSSNEVLAEAPELYLYAALVAAEPYLANDERLGTWADLYTDARDRVNQLALAQQRAGPLTSRVVGSTP